MTTLLVPDVFKDLTVTLDGAGLFADTMENGISRVSTRISDVNSFFISYSLPVGKNKSFFVYIVAQKIHLVSWKRYRRYEKIWGVSLKKVIITGSACGIFAYPGQRHRGCGRRAVSGGSGGACGWPGGGLDEPCRIKIPSIKARSYKLQSYNAEYNLIKQDKYKLEWIIIERNDV